MPYNLLRFIYVGRNSLLTNCGRFFRFAGSCGSLKGHHSILTFSILVVVVIPDFFNFNASGSGHTLIGYGKSVCLIARNDGCIIVFQPCLIHLVDNRLAILGCRKAGYLSLPCIGIGRSNFFGLDSISGWCCINLTIKSYRCNRCIVLLVCSICTFSCPYIFIDRNIYAVRTHAVYVAGIIPSLGNIYFSSSGYHFIGHFDCRCSVLIQYNRFGTVGSLVTGNSCLFYGIADLLVTVRTICRIDRKIGPCHHIAISCLNGSFFNLAHQLTVGVQINFRLGAQAGLVILIIPFFSYLYGAFHRLVLIDDSKHLFLIRDQINAIRINDFLRIVLRFIRFVHFVGNFLTLVIEWQTTGKILTPGFLICLTLVIEGYGFL